jgi:branched-chain amino acid transport system ATP-binding protein
MLHAEGIVVRYGDFTALRGVSLHIEPGEFVSIIGPNGAGKSTLINVLTGMLRPAAGSIRFKGLNILGIGPARLAQLGMARSFQLASNFPNLTVAECLEVAVVSRLGLTGNWFGCTARNRYVKDQVEEIAELFGLYENRFTLARHLPEGGKKLLDVASAFALYPEIILLDEPTSSVSTAEKSNIMEKLVNVSSQVGTKSLILVEHDMDIVFSYSKRVIALLQGQVLADAPLSEIRANEQVIRAVIGAEQA